MVDQKAPGKDWKDLLQASGVPLEQSVRSIVRSLGIHRANELAFERVNEDGKSIIASADVYGALEIEPFRVRLLVECKHRHDGTRWLFAPRHPDVRERCTLRNVASVEGALHGEFKVRATDLISTLPFEPMSPGVELKDKAFESDIRKAIFQLRYGMHHLYFDYLLSMADEVSVGYEVIPAFVPILVTTAELWSLRKEVGYYEVRNAKLFEDVAERKETLIVYSPPDRLVQREFAARANELPVEAKERLDELVKREKRLRGGPTSFKALVRSFAGRPKFYLVTNLDSFKWLTEDVLDRIRAVRWEDLRSTNDAEAEFDEPDE